MPRKRNLRFVSFRIVGSALMLCAHLSLSAASGQEQIQAFTEPYRDIEVAAGEMGTLSNVFVDEGDRVTAGELLAELVCDDLEATLEMASAAAQARGRLNSALAELRLQTDRLQRLQGLRARNHASQQEVDRALMQKEIAEAQVQIAHEELQQKSLDVERIKAQIEKRRLRSPIDGIVTRILRDEGEFISVNDPVVIKVLQLDPLRVEFMVPSASVRDLRVDQTVRVLIEDRIEVEAILEFVSPTIDAESDTVRTKVRIPNPQGILQSGAACVLLLEAPQSTRDRRDRGSYHDLN